MLGIKNCLLCFLAFQMLIFPKSNNNGNEKILAKNWFIVSSEKIKADGKILSLSNYIIGNEWYPAVVPSTVMSTLVDNKVYKNVFTGDNLKKIPTAQFEKPWWYRTEFTLSRNENKTIKLEFNGIVYRANIWLNGVLLGNADSIKGDFRRFEFDVTSIVKEKNTLAVEIIPPVAGEPAIGFADWNPRPPDNSMGIWRNVKIKTTGDVSVNYPYVQSTLDINTLDKAALTVSAELINNNKVKSVNGILTGEIGNIKFSKTILLKPGEEKKIMFIPSEYPQLIIVNPKIWWPYNMGKQPLYNLKLKYKISGKTSDECQKKFGIRKSSDYINKDGFRGYKINGKNIQILGGGWVDNIFLKNNYENITAQLQYVKQMGLNAIRLEGFWGMNDDLYDLCDEYGILIMAGWSCQWENDEFIGKHVDDYGGIESKEDMQMIAQSWQDQIKHFRNHPSIFLWLYGSDRIPRPELEKKYIKILKESDTTRPVLQAVSEHTSEITGNTAVKMRGPYAYVPPTYWWSDKQKGGAFGFNTEQGPGAQVPVIESIKKMIPSEHLWPVDSIWNYHCPTGTFNSMASFNEQITKRLGAPKNLEEYCTKAQYLNYENARAMYEAMEANKYVATGAIHWMLNAAWPKLWWQLYDYYLAPTGAFYGVMKARQEQDIMYDYDDNSIIVVNNTWKQKDNLTAKIKILNFDLSLKYTKEILISLKQDESLKILSLPEIKDLSKTYFLDLKLESKNETESDNFYCLSTTRDVLDTANAAWYVTPVKISSDFTDLNKLEKVKLDVSKKIILVNDEYQIETEIKNNSSNLAFQVLLSVNKYKNGELVLPVFWSDNYISLLPGEIKIIKCHFSKKCLEGEKPEIKVSGWNIIENKK